MEDKKYYLSKEGLKKLKEEYQKLKQYKIDKTRMGSPKMLESEDLSPEFVAFQEDLELMENRLTELETILNHTEIIKPDCRNKDVVALGSVVKVKFGNETDKYHIVGTLEADPLSGKVSNESPVGKSLIGHKKGETVVVHANKDISCKIVEVDFDSC
jgi:transcription elongation factor GreA